LVSYLLLSIPTGYLLAFECGMGPAGLALGLLCGLTTAALLTSLRVRYQVRRRRTAVTGRAAK